MADWERQEGYDLSGKRALVVGFANPAGRAITEALAEAGANVAVASATMDGDEVMAAKRASRAIAKLGRETFSQGWDVTLPTNVRVGLRQLVKAFGVPSVLSTTPTCRWRSRSARRATPSSRTCRRST